MVRYSRRSKRMVGGGKHKQLVGSRVQVWNGTALKTSYGKHGLRKHQLRRNKHGRIVSRKKSSPSEKTRLLKQLRKAGYTTQKGKFGAVKVGSKAKRTRKRRRSRRKGRRCRHRSGSLKGRFKKC